MTNQEFANLFAMAQSIPGPNMILMMSFVGWKVWGFPGAVVSAFATFGPPCLLYFGSYRLWDRFHHAPWQPIVRSGLAPVTIGLVIASMGCEREARRFDVAPSPPDARAQAQMESSRSTVNRTRARCDDARRARFEDLESGDAAVRTRELSAGDAWVRAQAQYGEVSACERLAGGATRP